MDSSHFLYFLLPKLFIFLDVFLRVSSWNYIANSENGPSKWGNTYPACMGNKQSPIDIKREHLKFSTRMLAFELPGYETIPRGAHWELHNTGHLVQIRLNGEYKMQEGGLTGQYKAMQMDFHWGTDERNGSEHMINGSRFPMELQIIHYNLKYGSYDEALLHEDGLAAFAFLFKIKENDNPIFAQIIKNLPNIKHKGQFVTLRPVPLLSMLPINLNDYYRYEGSLTQPPCSEIITWTVFTEFIELSHGQLAQFQRSVMRNPPGHEEVDEAMKENSRPLQPQNDRIIYSSMISDATLWTAPLSPISITLAVFIGFVLLFLILGRQQKLEMEVEPTMERIPQQLNHHLD